MVQTNTQTKFGQIIYRLLLLKMTNLTCRLHELQGHVTVKTYWALNKYALSVSWKLKWWSIDDGRREFIPDPSCCSKILCCHVLKYFTINPLPLQWPFSRWTRGLASPSPQFSFSISSKREPFRTFCHKILCWWNHTLQTIPPAVSCG